MGGFKQNLIKNSHTNAQDCNNNPAKGIFEGQFLASDQFNDQDQDKGGHTDR